MVTALDYPRGVSMYCSHVESRTAWILLALYAPDSNYGKDGLMKVSWPKHVGKINIKYIVVFDRNQKRILSSFSLIKSVPIPGLQPLACKDCGFESRRRYGCFFCCCVLSGRDLCVGLITRPEESYRVWCVWVWSWSLNKEETLTHQGLFAPY
jgi:hypothetical protein